MKLPPELEAKILGLTTHVNGVAVERPELASIDAPAADCTERELQAAAARAAREFGWEHYHTFDSRRSAPGFPDSWFGREWGELRVFAVEWKVPPKKPTEAQRMWSRILRGGNVPAYCFYPHDWPAFLELLRAA